jgi:hypothetical protein
MKLARTSSCWDEKCLKQAGFRVLATFADKAANNYFDAGRVQ